MMAPATAPVFAILYAWDVDTEEITDIIETFEGECECNFNMHTRDIVGNALRQIPDIEDKVSALYESTATQSKRTEFTIAVFVYHQLISADALANIEHADALTMRYMKLCYDVCTLKTRCSS
jgi:hypothetical protein